MPSPWKEQVTYALKEARRLGGVSAAELGATIGKSERTIRRSEAGDSELALNDMHKWFEACGVDMRIEIVKRPYRPSVF